ncbi:MAG: ATP-binding cassette domain-containing protein [Thermodesulfobacteriota bacterium]|nr:ATP-binding cassette domain-containing protein [Thermodesulfobacteriota bacterium]
MRITLRDIHKHYGKIHANDGINMEIARGTIHGLLGENGAGKSTLMKILAGYIPKTGGTILLDGKPVNYKTTAQATELGIGMLYQDPLDFLQLSVLENFMIGLSHGLYSGYTGFRHKLTDSCDFFGFSLDPDAPVHSLTVGERQQLELLRLLALGVQILILDEPTTGISSIQKEILFKALRQLASQQKTILLVSHKLNDVETLCDRSTVLREGRVAGEMDRPFDTHTLLEWMFGTPPLPPARPEIKPGQVTLVMEKVSASGGHAGLKNCTMTMRQGEVIGLVGLEGSGQGIFLRLAAGLEKPEKGTIQLHQKLMSGRDYHTFKSQGVSFLPTARLEEGLIPGLTITEHFALHQNKGIIIPWEMSRRQADEKIELFKIVGTPSSTVESLSGGNQQRLLLSLMSADPYLLLLEQPTRGLDMESARWVWQQLMSHADKGAGIIFSSAELEEILLVADRVLVFFNGTVVKDVKTRDTNLNELGRAIAGTV